MSISVTRASHKANFAAGAIPTAAQFSLLIDGFPMIYNETVTLVANTDYTITHGNAEKARIVQATDTAGEQIDITWRRDPADPTNKVIINSAKAETDAEISILTK